MIFNASGNMPSLLWGIETNVLEEGQYIDFDQLLELQKVVNQLVSDEQSRLLQESLSGDFVCDGCTI
ncbi:hypothetical protein CH16_gp039 [Escherichia phage KBNP1711]|uniref:Uncharacterized protein n=1 Tax=Escherichia phage KBNP1711 TaxID=1436889 RepID=W6AS77_9CAUD|nr:hypothetical protein CH16_gp039 [Escherichia phage KBNP1711]AHI60816.1 hypothetical protein ECBP3_0039 [Escherichia phage KBNP1711]